MRVRVNIQRTIRDRPLSGAVPFATADQLGEASLE